jgi:hypothetical protein
MTALNVLVIYILFVFQDQRAFLILNYKLGSHTAQLRSEARKAAIRKKDACMANDYRLTPLSKEEKSFIRSINVDFDNTACITFLEAFFSSENQSTQASESSFPMMAQLGHMIKNKKWVNNLPKPKDQKENKNLIRNILYKAGLEVYKGREKDNSLPIPQKIVDKFSVDPDYRLQPLSEDEKGWLVALGIDVNDAECTAYMEAFLEKMKKHAENGSEQKEQSVNEQTNQQIPLSSNKNESSLLTKLKKMVNDYKWVSNLPEPKDESEMKNLIQNILYKAGIEDVDEGEFDSLLILPASRQIIGKFQLVHFVLGGG